MKKVIGAVTWLALTVLIGMLFFGIYDFGYKVGNSDMKIQCLDILGKQVETEQLIKRTTSEMKRNDSQTLLNNAKTLDVVSNLKGVPEPGPTPAPRKESLGF